MDEIQLSAVQEAMNQMMGSAATSMSTIFSKKVDISPPSLHLLDLKEGEGFEYLPPDDVLVKVSFRLKVGNLIDSNIMQLLPIHFAKELVENLLNPSSTKTETSATINTNEPHQTASSAQTKPAPSSAQQTQKEAPQHFGTGAVQQPVNVQPVAFASFEPAPLPEAESRNLDMLLDIPLQVTVELGRTKRSVQDILSLSSGSIIELDKLAGEPVDILVNNKLIAKGEVVVIDENFGVRVTSIISQSDRLNKLR